MTITSASKINKRYYQEDFFFIDTMKNGDVLFGVFDGHGGDYTSYYANKYTKYIFKAVRKLYPELTPNETLSEVFKTLVKRTSHFTSGSTANIVWYEASKRMLHIANLGDSKIIVKTKKNVFQSEDHNIRSNPDDAKNVIDSRVGIICNGYLMNRFATWLGGLQPTRSLGDRELDSVLSRIPSIQSIKATKGTWVLCCTDGVIDSDQSLYYLPDYVDFINENTNTAEDLLNFSMNYDYISDNATAIIARF
jgi:serine/threonine protein phosphatase PrpC